MQRYSRSAKIFIGFVLASGLATLCYGASTQQWQLDLRFASLLVVAVLASRLKVSLPELNSCMSVNLPFLLLAAAWLSLPGALITGCAAALAQSIPTKNNSFRPIQVLFNLSSMSIGVVLAWTVLNCDLVLRATELPEKMMLLIVATAIFFAAQTIPVAVILSLTGAGKAFLIWLEIFTYTFAYYVLSTGVAALVSYANGYAGWHLPLGSLIVMFGVYRSFKRYFRSPATLEVEATGAALKSQAAGAI